MLRRLRCQHSMPHRKEWRFGKRIVWTTWCPMCGSHLDQGTSDEWLIPPGFLDELMAAAMAPNPYRHLQL